jgi:tetratricopeptide (TPR) repeat protein
LETSNVEALYNRGLAYQKLKCFDRAIEDFTRIIALRPDFTQAYFERGNTYFDKRMDSHAIEDYTKALDLDSGQVEAIYNRGLAYKRAKEYDAAHRDFKKVCTLGSQAACEKAKELVAVMAAKPHAPISDDLEEQSSSITRGASFQAETSKGAEVSEKLVAEKVPECSEGFLNLSDGTIKDCRTGLIWFKDLTSPGGIKNRHEAVAYCQSITATYCGTFRLPTRDELETFSKHLSLSENQSFAKLRSGFYWTGGNYDAHHAWIVYLFPCTNERWNTKENTFCNVLPVCSLNGN